MKLKLFVACSKKIIEVIKYPLITKKISTQQNHLKNKDIKMVKNYS